MLATNPGLNRSLLAHIKYAFCHVIIFPVWLLKKVSSSQEFDTPCEEHIMNSK